MVHFGYSPEQAIEASIAGCGVMIASKTLALLDFSSGRLMIPFGPEVSTHMNYQIVTLKGTCMREEISAFKTWLLKELKPYCESGHICLAVNGLIETSKVS